MTRLVRFVLVAAALMFAVSLSAAMRQDDASSGPPPSGAGLPDGPGKDVTVQICGHCHAPQRIASVRFTRDGWSSTIDNMVQRGAKGTPQELSEVLDYLTTNFLGSDPPPLDINTAAPIDLESVLSLLRKEAAALVAYRTKHGPFKKLDDLKNVEGLDFEKIEKNKDRIVF